MREILFRGKRKYNGDWVYGYYEKTYTYDTEKQLDRILWVDEKLKTALLTDVFPDTVGQYTGLTDKNGIKIFEGDIVRCGEWNGSRKYLVEMDEDRRGWYPFACGDGCGCCESETESPKNSEIIGNIHDNPDLLKGE